MTTNAVREGQLLWEPPEDVEQSCAIARFQRWLQPRVGQSFAGYNDLWRWSVDNVEEFWSAIWEYFDVRASTPYERVLSSREMPGARWFDGASLNYAEHVLAHDGARPAIIAVTEDGDRRDITWGELRTQVAAVAATLRELGVARGDRVVGYIPNIPEATIAFLACASLGAIWSSCSPDFGVRSVVDRFRQIHPKVLFAVDGYRYNGRPFDRVDVVDALRGSLPSLTHTVMVPYLEPDRSIPQGLVPWEQCLQQSEPLTFEQVPFDHPLWILYTSGTTGMPKGIVHGHGGIVVDLLCSMGLHFDLGEQDTFFWFTTTGWVMWNIVVSGLMLGATVVQYDGAPGFPHIGRLWEVAAETKTSFLGMSAGYITACEKEGLVPGQSYDLTALRAAGFTGSPLAPQLYDWVYRAVDPSLWFTSVSGGTDVCGPFLGGNPQLPVHAGELQCRVLGVNVQAFDGDGNPVIGEVGELVVTDPLPSMPIYLWGDEDGSRYHEGYFDMYPGVWRHGDWLRITERGSAVIYGRSDSTINRMGVRMGSAEIYRAVEDLPEIIDSLIVDLTYVDRESQLPLFVVLKEDGKLDDDLRRRITEQVRSQTSPRHVPDPIIEVREVPKTLNNKKLEVPVRKIMLGMNPEEVVNRDSVSNPEALDAFIELAKTRFS